MWQTGLRELGDVRDDIQLSGGECSVSGLRKGVDRVAPLREGLCKLIYPVPRYGDYAPTEYSR
jgi:hypothetical protein